MASPSSQDSIDMKSSNMDQAEHQKIYEAGLEVRRKVVGEDYVEKALANQSDFSRPLQQFATVRIMGEKHSHSWSHHALEIISGL